MTTSERLQQITDHVLWWPLELVDKMKPGPAKFMGIIYLTPTAKSAGYE